MTTPWPKRCFFPFYRPRVGCVLVKASILGGDQPQLMSCLVFCLQQSSAWLVRKARQLTGWRGNSTESLSGHVCEREGRSRRFTWLFLSRRCNSNPGMFAGATLICEIKYAKNVFQGNIWRSLRSSANPQGSPDPGRIQCWRNPTWSLGGAGVGLGWRLTAALMDSF